MATGNQHDVKVLNGLYSATLDNAQGYRDAADVTTDAGHRALFETREGERRALAGELEATIVALGGTPDHGGSILAKAQRAVRDIGHALKGDEATRVGEVDGGESALLARFDGALEDTGISATTRETLRRARDRVRADHDGLGALKQSVQGQRDAESGLFPH